MHLDILRLRWEELEPVNGDDDAAMRREIGLLVAEHQSLMRLLAAVHRIFRQLYRVQVCSSTCTLCTAAVNILLNAATEPWYTVRFAVFAAASLLQLLFWSWAGQRTFVSGERIAAAVYASDWLAAGPAVRRSVALVLLRAQRPMVFSAAPFYVLNYVSFVAVRAVFLFGIATPIYLKILCKHMHFSPTDSERIVFVFYAVAHAAGFVNGKCAVVVEQKTSRRDAST